jgi:hypothetical protein
MASHSEIQESLYHCRENFKSHQSTSTLMMEAHFLWKNYLQNCGTLHPKKPWYWNGWRGDNALDSHLDSTEFETSNSIFISHPTIQRCTDELLGTSWSSPHKNTRNLEELCSPLNVNRHFGGTVRLHLQCPKDTAKQGRALLLPPARRWFLEDGGDMLLRNVGWFSTDYTILYPGRQNSEARTLQSVGNLVLHHRANLFNISQRRPEERRSREMDSHMWPERFSQQRQTILGSVKNCTEKNNWSFIPSTLNRTNKLARFHVALNFGCWNASS